MTKPATGLFDDLLARGLIKQSTDPELPRVLREKKLTLYAGFDPTADSLHIGNLVPLLTLKRFQLAGHTPIALVGGATGLIGDPGGKTEERKLLDPETIRTNLIGIREAIGKVLDLKGPTPARVVDNMDWFQKLSFIEVLRDIGKHFSVNQMIAKESVRARLEDRDQGISFTEFSYQILQAYDFHKLHEDFDCTLQLGGSEQWGNITAGCEFIRRIHAAKDLPEAHVYGLTLPLITKSDGSKFGKSESGSVWLHAHKTSPYSFYQFWVQTDDADAVRFLHYFTLLSLDEIQAIETEFKRSPEKRVAQQKLAQEVTRMIHGEKELARAEKISQALFSGDARSLDPESLKEAFSGAPKTLKPKSSISANDGLPLLDLLVETGLVSSKGIARKEILAGGIYVNDERVTDPLTRFQSDALLGNRYLTLRKGKRNYHLVEFQ